MPKGDNMHTSVLTTHDSRSDQLTRRGFEILEIESHQSELRPIVCGREAVGPTDPVPPAAGDSSRLVDVAVETQQRLTIFEETPDGDGPDVDIERHVIHRLSIEGRPVEVALIRR